VDDLSLAAQIATHYMDVVTTSGPATGEPAEVEKIKTMKKSIGDFPLAIASGITPENVSDCLPYADIFLVATGISKNFFDLDSDKVHRLSRSIHNFATG
jgi:predicted TIM-barrel enzyme